MINNDRFTGILPDTVDMNVYHIVVVNSEIGRQWDAARRTSGSLPQRSMGNSLW